MFIADSKKSERSDCVLSHAQKAVYEFCHDDDFTQLDSYSNRTYQCTTPTGDKVTHPKKIWCKKGGYEIQLQLFRHSCHYKNFKASVRADPRKSKSFQTKEPQISMTVFRQFICNCVSNPITASCVDVKRDKLYCTIDAFEDLFAAPVTSG